MNLKTALAGKISEWQLKGLKKSFDIIGDIIIIEIPDDLAVYEKDIVDALKKTHPRVKTVCKKMGERKGIKRLRLLKVIYGSETETEHKEHGCRIRLDVKKVYFSPREGTERERIGSWIKPKEKVLVMFSGVAPYALVGARMQPQSTFVCTDINRDAVRYAEDNVRINHLQEMVKNIHGDIKKVYKKLGKFSRIIMPLPETAYKHVDIAIECCKKGGYIHLYGIGEKGDMFSDLEKRVEKAAKKSGRKIKVVRKRKVLPFAPGIYKVCLDLKVS